MQRSQLPTTFNIPWANSGTRNVIPQASQIGTTPGAASLTDGFPPLTMQNLSTGGIPPDGADTNGILYEITGVIQWGINAGASYPWSSAFSTAVGGYPQGAVVTRANGTGAWFSTVDNNTTNPDTGGAGWLPAEGLGVNGGTEFGIITFNTPAADTTAATGIKANVNGATRIDPNGSSFLIPVSPADVTGARALFSMKRTDNGNQIWSINADGSMNVLSLTASGGVTAATGNFITRVGGNTAQSSVTMGGGVFNLSQSANALDTRLFQIRYDMNVLNFYLSNDAQTAVTSFMAVTGGSDNAALSLPVPTSATTQAPGNSSTLLATTAFVQGVAGRLINIQILSTLGTSTYTATAGTTSILVEGIGTGGAGAGALATNSSQVHCGGGGGSGGRVLARYTSNFNGATVIIGAPGSGVVGDTGGSGQSCTFTPPSGTALLVHGGIGAAPNPSLVIPNASPGGAGAAISTGGFLNFAGSPAGAGYYISVSGVVSGQGGSTIGGGGAGIPFSNNGQAGGSWGGGGSGAANGPSQSARAGGNGFGGCFIVYEFS